MDRAVRVHERLKGPVVPINVCFNEDGTVNHEAVARYVDWLCREQTMVLLLTGGSSEYASLSDQEVWQLTETVAQAAAGRSLFVTSTPFWKPALTREFLKHADAVGADAVKVQINPGFPMTREVLNRYFDQIDGVSDIPLLLWSIPEPRFPIEVVAELAKRTNIVGMKNDGDQFYDYYDLIRATADQRFGVISGGQMRNFIFGYQVGSPAYLCPIAPFRPAVALQFYQYLVEGRYDDAWQFVFRYEEPFLQWALDHDWLAVMKSAVMLQGLYPNNLPGPPRPAPPPELLEQVRAKLEEIFGASTT